MIRFIFTLVISLFAVPVIADEINTITGNTVSGQVEFVMFRAGDAVQKIERDDIAAVRLVSDGHDYITLLTGERLEGELVSATIIKEGEPVSVSRWQIKNISIVDVPIEQNVPVLEEPTTREVLQERNTELAKRYLKRSDSMKDDELRNLERVFAPRLKRVIDPTRTIKQIEPLKTEILLRHKERQIKIHEVHNRLKSGIASGAVTDELLMIRLYDKVMTPPPPPK